MPETNDANNTAHPPGPRLKRAPLAGWGRYPTYLSEVYRPETRAELSEIVASESHQLLPRGAGRAYGDAALNAPGRLIDLTRLNRMLSFYPETGILRCEAGVTFSDIIETFLPRGFFPAVVPGTRFVTMGGAIAADVHGKNHHRDSSLSAHVLSFDLMLASGEIRRCSHEENTDLFWATLGGMGLTGIVLEVELQLQRVESAWIESEVVRVPNIDEAIKAFERIDRDYRYSVAWIDCASRGTALGRSVIELGDFATYEQLNPRQRRTPLSVRPRFSAAVPIDLPGFALSPLTVRAFNAVYYRRHRSTPRRLVDYERFFFPLDSMREWNRIYGRRGFVQYQCVWPLEESRAGLIEVLEEVTRSRRASFLAVLKKFGPQEGMLSFPIPGYTLALDFPVRDGLMAFLDRLDSMVLRRGGRVYLAKDARMRPEVFQAMYPKLDAWRAIRAAADPNNRFSSSLSRRLGMDSGQAPA